LERDAGVSDRFAAEGQRVEYAFACEAGELALFSLETWGYARGWRSGGRIRVLDADGNALVQTERSGPSVWHELTAFVAPEAGTFRYELTSFEQCFRFRLVRRAGYVPRTLDDVEPIGARALLHSYLASKDDVARFTLELADGEEVFLKVLNTDEAGRSERRTLNPPRLGAGSIGGFVHPTFELALSVDGTLLVEHRRSLLLRAPRAGTYEIAVSTHAPGAAGLFDLEARRRVEKVVLTGTVRDRDDAPLPGAVLTFLHGIDRDVVGAVRTARDGSFTVDVPSGRLRIRIENVPIPAEIDAVVTTSREIHLVP
jgi:hypothetical protein